MTAVREANQIGTLQPTTLVAYEADIGPLFDAADPAVLAARRLTAADLAGDDWRARMRAEGEASSQRLARALIEEGYAGMQVMSFAAGSAPTDLNLVLWTWGPRLPARLRLVDDEDRLA
jgi:RES domain-containing protein